MCQKYKWPGWGNFYKENPQTSGKAKNKEFQ